MAAQRLGVKVLGTVGVVLRLKQAGVIPEAKTALLTIRNAGGYVSDALLREALQRVGEVL
jgi:predicted nucleic acid-binding protein